MIKSITEIVLFIFIILTLFFFLKSRQHKQETFQVGALLGQQNLWWIVDSETNSRNWWDFGARNSSLPNKGYLKVALDCLKKTQGADFTVHVLLGRDAVNQILVDAGAIIPQNANSMPIAVWRQWCMSNLLTLKGGLAIMGDSTLCVGPSFASYVLNKDAAVFGMNPSEASVLPGSETVGPAPWVAWSSRPFHPGWKYAAEKWNAIASAGPTAWTSSVARRENLIIWDTQKTMGISLIQEAEGSRNPDGSERTLEDLLGRETTPQDPKTVLLPGTVYVPFDGDTLARTYRYAWFVRMSEGQIMESDFVWAGLAKKVLFG